MKNIRHLLLSLAPLFAASFASAIQVQLQNPELALSVIATDATRAREFYVESLGLVDNGEASNPPPGLHMYLYGSGQATVKVRVYDTDPPGRDPSLLAENGLRFITIPVSDFDGALARLAARGFAAPVVQTSGGVRTGMAADGDGNVVEMLDAATAPARKLEIGVITDADGIAAAQFFYTNLLGFAEAIAAPGPSPVSGSTEYRYKANNTVLRFFGPPGARATPADPVGGVLGYRYITFTVSNNVDVLHDQMVAAGVPIASPLAPHGTNAMLFIARGPGGALHEFVGPPRVPHSAFTDLVFTQDYYAPAYPSNSPMSETLEALSLEPHKGRLFCSTCYVGLDRTVSSSDPKVLVKDTAASPWRVDYEMGALDARIPILRSVKFTTDGAGNVLTNAAGEPEPAAVLIAGTGQWAGWYNVNDPNRYGVYVLTRDDTSNTWVRHKLYHTPWNPLQLNHANEVRMLADHVDAVTGVHYVFAFSQSGRAFRGWYDTNAPGNVAWAAQPEFDNTYGLGLCAAECNGALYVGMAYTPNGDNPPVLPRPSTNFGLWRRMDGIRDPVNLANPPATNAQWQWISIPEWQDPLAPTNSIYSGQLRGLTAIPDPKGGAHRVLAMHWDSPDSKLYIVDPMDNHKATIELDTRQFIRGLWGNTAGAITVGYNDWLPATHPDTGEEVHLLSAWFMYPGGETNSPEGKSSWFLARYADAAYSLVRIWDPENPLTGAEYGLRGCRSIRPSPFPNEAGRVWYFCGFDLTGIGGPDIAGPRGWIYKGTIGYVPPLFAVATETDAFAGLTVGKAFSYTLSVSGGTPPYTWTVAGGSLPPGLSLSGGGILSGTPTAPGSYDFTVQATDGIGAIATRTYSVKVGSFLPDDAPVGSAGIPYLDPEFHSPSGRMVFQTFNGGVREIWIAELDPANGLLVSADGKDLLVDTDVATLGPQEETNNGPEWGEDSDGVSVFYSKMGGNGFVQVWRASNLSNGFVTVTPLTSVAGSNAINACVRQDASRPTTQFFYRHALGPEYPGPCRWADETRPTETNNILAYSTAGFAPSWIEGTEDFAYVAYVSATNAAVEIARCFTALRTSSAVSAEPGVAKRSAIAFKAPEYSNDLCYACVADGGELAVYRNLGAGYARVATLTANDPAHPYMYSPEIFQAGGVTYFAVVMQNHHDYHLATDGAIYVLGLGSNPATRLARRVDDGTAANRIEPEIYVGAEEAFVFFNVGGELHRARTGILKHPVPVIESAETSAGALVLRTGSTQPGFACQAQTSTNLATWADYGEAIMTDGEHKILVIPVGDEPVCFYRLIQRVVSP